jgi:hypothetical protein
VETEEATISANIPSRIRMSIRWIGWNILHHG